MVFVLDNFFGLLFRVLQSKHPFDVVIVIPFSFQLCDLIIELVAFLCFSFLVLKKFVTDNLLSLEGIVWSESLDRQPPFFVFLHSFDSLLLFRLEAFVIFIPVRLDLSLAFLLLQKAVILIVLVVLRFLLLLLESCFLPGQSLFLLCLLSLFELSECSLTLSDSRFLLCFDHLQFRDAA